MLSVSVLKETCIFLPENEVEPSTVSLSLWKSFLSFSWHKSLFLCVLNLSAQPRGMGIKDWACPWWVRTCFLLLSLPLSSPNYLCPVSLLIVNDLEMIQRALNVDWIRRLVHLRWLELAERVQALQHRSLCWVSSGGVMSVHPSPGLKLSMRRYFVFFLKLPCRGVPGDKIQWSVLRGAHSGFLHQCQGERKTVFLYRITNRILCVFYNELPIME